MNQKNETRTAVARTAIARQPGRRKVLGRFPKKGIDPSRRALSLSDLEVPVEDLLTHADEMRLGREIQAAFARLRKVLPLIPRAFQLYLQQMSEVSIGYRVVVAWFPLRQNLDSEFSAASGALGRARVRAREILEKKKNKKPRFTAAEERVVHRILDRGIKILRRYPLDLETVFSWSMKIAREGSSSPLSRTLRHDKALRILKRSIETIERARDRLVLPNLRLVLKDVFRYQPHGMRRSDLFQEGILGLHRAVFRYNPERKTRFSTYATYWIRQSIRKALIDRSRLIRIPQAVQEELRKPERKMSENEADRIRHVMGEAVSISPDDDFDQRDRVLFDVHRKATALQDEQFHLGVIPSTVERALSSLTLREREVLRRRFGISGDRQQTLEEIGVALHLSRERIRQIEREALEKMREREDLQSVFEDMG